MAPAASSLVLALVASTRLVLGAAPPPILSSSTLNSPASSFPPPWPSPSTTDAPLSSSEDPPLPTSLPSMLPADATGTASAAFFCHLFCPWRTKTIIVTRHGHTTSVTVTATTTLTPSCSLLPSSSGLTVSLPTTSPTPISLPTASLPTLSLPDSSALPITSPTPISLPTASLPTLSLPSSALPPSAHPTLECSVDAYFIDDKKLLKVSLSTGSTTVLAADVGGSGLDIQAVGFNSLDNYLYGLQGPNIVRISADGSIQIVASLPEGAKFNMGDVDGNGTYRLSDSGSAWADFDLKPGSSTYGQALANGTADPQGLSNLGSWASTPEDPGYLYSMGVKDGVPILGRCSMSDHEWTTVYDKYVKAQVPIKLFSSLCASSDGTLCASETTLGIIVCIKLADPEDIVVVPGPRGTSSSGARCALVPA
ncbi:hypothetical protein CDD82_7355 [Ophiocordyceps australis]|uniref:DUF6923 domain-containing protein n=1 Tax=Ophiocordyceps australis TaxID=1399860 RepID=A0A2C5YKM6_9HYPO|nr:hypothetical protein CDD82_7355 [Ophiocordyceps australis]